MPRNFLQTRFLVTQPSSLHNLPITVRAPIKDPSSNYLSSRISSKNSTMPPTRRNRSSEGAHTGTRSKNRNIGEKTCLGFLNLTANSIETPEKRPQKPVKATTPELMEADATEGSIDPSLRSGEYTTLGTPHFESPERTVSLILAFSIIIALRIYHLRS